MPNNSHWIRHALAVATLALAAGTAGAATTVLFQPSLGINTQWLGCGASGSVVCDVSSAGLAVALGDRAGMGGLSNHPALLALVPGLPPINPAFPVLDRSLGYRLDFSLSLLAEQHASPHRAGFSVTLIGSDLMGIEIGFQRSLPPADPLAAPADDARIFAQNDGLQGDVRFTQGEHNASAEALAALAGPTRWALQVQGDAYALMRADTGQTLLQGALRNYSAQTGFGANAYKTPSFLFAGDNTSSAAGAWVVDRLSLTTPVPEPASAGLMLGGGALLAAACRRRRPGPRREPC